MVYGTSRSHIEVRGFAARFYDELLRLLTLGAYQRLLRKAVGFLKPRRGESVLDMGSGTGYVACLIAPQVGPKGRVVGLDIGPEMLRRARSRCRHFSWVEFRELRIDGPMLFREEFDAVFISFVLHGFENEKRSAILSNALAALRPGGRLVTVDYGEFALREAPWTVRALFRFLECPLAREFIGIDQKGLFTDAGFRILGERCLWGPYIRALRAVKPG